MKPLNGHQFSQGNFGSIEPTMNVKPTDEHRYPRGYTPERQAEVADALPAEKFRVVSSHVKPSGYGDPQAASTKAYDRSHPGPETNGTDVADRMNDAMRGPFRARVVDTVARSSVPVEHLRDNEISPPSIPTLEGSRKPWAHENVPPRTVKSPRFELAPPNPGVAGEHDIGIATQYSDGRRVYSPTIRVFPTEHTTDRDSDYTLLHELGHQQSNAADTSHALVNVNGRRHHTPARSGKEEGFADRYATEHLVRRREEDPSVAQDAPYPASQYGFTGSDAATFNNNYGNAHWMKPVDESGRTPYSIANDQPLAERERNTAIQHARTDAPSTPHLWMREAESVVTSNVPDYGQHHMRTPEDRPLDTIKVGGGVPAEIQQRTADVTEAWDRARNDLGRSPAYYPGGSEQHAADMATLSEGVKDNWVEQQAAKGEVYLQRLKDKGYRGPHTFASHKQTPNYNEFVEKARAAHPWPES